MADIINIGNEGFASARRSRYVDWLRSMYSVLDPEPLQGYLTYNRSTGTVRIPNNEDNSITIFSLLGRKNLMAGYSTTDQICRLSRQTSLEWAQFVWNNRDETRLCAIPGIVTAL